MRGPAACRSLLQVAVQHCIAASVSCALAAAAQLHCCCGTRAPAGGAGGGIAILSDPSSPALQEYTGGLSAPDNATFTSHGIDVDYDAGRIVTVDFVNVGSLIIQRVAPHHPSEWRAPDMWPSAAGCLNACVWHVRVAVAVHAPCSEGSLTNSSPLLCISPRCPWHLRCPAGLGTPRACGIWPPSRS